MEKCYPQFEWLRTFLNLNKVRDALAIPDGVYFVPLSEDVGKEFDASADMYVPISLRILQVF